MKKEIETNGSIVAGMRIYDYNEFNLANANPNISKIYKVWEK